MAGFVQESSSEAKETRWGLLGTLTQVSFLAGTGRNFGLHEYKQLCKFGVHGKMHHFNVSTHGHMVICKIRFLYTLNC